MDGVELLGFIRKVDPEVPVILMTAYANLDMAIDVIKMGAFDFIIKPFDPDTLVAAVNKAIKYRDLCQLEKNHKVRLEEALAERTRELQELHEQMVLSEKLASIGLLAAGIVHEINTPISFVSSNLGSMARYVDRMAEFLAWQTDVIKTCCSPEVLREQEQRMPVAKIDRIIKDMSVIVEESQEGVERIKLIVGSLKSFARKDADVVVEANLNDLVKSTLTIVWNEIKYVATLNKEFGNIPVIRCYPSQLNQVILNLLVNAAHAIEKDPGTISIRTWVDEALVCLEVSDTGCGISDENRDKIFAPFFTTKEAGVGTGLGLAISADIVRKHGGEILVASEVGAGTTFTVRLPVNGPLQ
jgi:two-component system NtrC family sensor kinase